MSHTPGPWIYCNNSGIHRNIWAGSKIIARVDEDEHDEETADANARLIAAAPFMLNALELVMSSVLLDDKDFRNFAVLLCQDAIAKAKGE